MARCINLSSDFLLTKTFVNLIKFHTKLLGFIGFCPLEIDQTSGKLAVKPTYPARFIQNWLWFMVYPSLVLPTHLVELYFRSNSQIKTFTQNRSLVFLLITITGCLISAVFLGILVINPLSVCQIFNAIYKYAETFTGERKS